MASSEAPGGPEVGDHRPPLRLETLLLLAGLALLLVFLALEPPSLLSIGSDSGDLPA